VRKKNGAKKAAYKKKSSSVSAQKLKCPSSAKHVSEPWWFSVTRFDYSGA
jgi:hypothetical protein